MKISRINTFLSTLNFVLFFIGYQLATSILLPLSSDIEGISRTVTVPYRGFALLISLIVIALNFRYKQQYKHPALWVFLFFWFILIIRMYYDIYIDSSININNTFQLWMYVFGICIPAIISVMKSIKQIELNTAFKWILYLSLFTIALTMFSNQILFISANELTGRQDGNIALNTISYGHLGTMGLTLSLWALLKQKNSMPTQILLIAFILLSTFAMLRAGSRGPIASLLIVALFWIFSAGRKIITGLILISLVSLIFILFIDQILTFLGYISPIIESRLRDTIYEGDTSNRNPLYIEAIQTFKNNPILGGNFSLKNNSGLIIYSHNMFLDALMGLGLIGGTSMLYFLFSAFKKSYQLIKHNDSAMWVALILIQQISASMFSGAFYYNQLLSALLAFIFVYRISNKTSEIIA